MTTFGIVISLSIESSDNGRYIRDFIDAGYFVGASTLLMKWTPSTNADIFPRHYAHLEKC